MSMAGQGIERIISVWWWNGLRFLLSQSLHSIEGGKRAWRIWKDWSDFSRPKNRVIFAIALIVMFCVMTLSLWSWGNFWFLNHCSPVKILFATGTCFRVLDSWFPDVVTVWACDFFVFFTNFYHLFLFSRDVFSGFQYPHPTCFGTHQSDSDRQSIVPVFFPHTWFCLLVS